MSPPLDGIFVVRLDPGACYSGRTICSDGIVVFSFADLHSAVLNRNIPTREDSCISGGGCLDLTVFNGNTATAKQRRVVAGSIHFCTIRDFQLSVCVNAIAVFTLCFNIAAGNCKISTHTKRHVIPGRLDGSIFCHADIRRRNQTITCIFAGRRPTLHFQIAVAAHCQVCAIRNFQSAHRIRRRRFRFRMQTAQLGAVLHRYRVGVVARLHTNFQRCIVTAGRVGHIRITVQYTSTIPLAGVTRICWRIYDNLRIRNVQCAGHIGCFLPHANIARIQRSCTLDRQVIRGHFADCIDRIFRNFQHHFDRAVLNNNAAIHSHIFCNDVERLPYFFGVVTAPDADFLIRFTRKYVGHIPLEKLD